MLRQINRNDRSVPEVLQDIAGNLEDIARYEFLLAKVEIKEEVAEAAKASRTLGAGIIFGFYALGFALLAVVYALATVVAVWLAALMVSASVSVIALAFITIGSTKLKAYEGSAKNLLAKENGKWANSQRISQDTLRTDATVSTTTSAH